MPGPGGLPHGPASASTLGSKPCRSPPHTDPAQMLPTALHPLGPAVPKKLLKHQSQVASPPLQGSENRQLFLFTQPCWDHQFSKAGSHPSPSHPWPKPVVRVVHHKGIELSATLRPAKDSAHGHWSSKAASSKESPISCHPSRQCHTSKVGKDHSPSTALRQRSLQQPGRRGQRCVGIPAHPSCNTAQGKPSS